MVVRTDLEADWGKSPRIIKVLAPSDELTAQDLFDTARSLEHLPDPGWDVFSYSSLLSGAGKEELGGGVLVGITITLLNSQVAFEARTTSECDGTATSADSAGITLIDTAADFVSDGVLPGAVIINFDDFSVATVIEVVDLNTIIHEPLKDGTNNDWTSGDYYKIWNYETCELSGGNVVAVNENGDSIEAVLPRFGVSYVRTSSSSATLSELAAIQYASFNGGVTVDLVNGVAGTEYNIGTPENPVGNFVDALAIASARGFDTFFLKGDVTLNSGTDFDEKIFVGESRSKTTITIASDADVENCEFYEATITGTLDGGNVLYNCAIGNLTYVNGYIERCVLSVGTVTLGGGGNAHFHDCWSGVIGAGAPIIDMGGSGQDLGVRGYDGQIEIRNLTGANSADLDLLAGKVILHSTLTAGTITIRGDTEIEDNSAGATIEDQTTLTKLNKILGLSGDNVQWSNLTHDANHLLTGARITQYEDETLTTPVRSWDVTATYDGDGELTSYNQVIV